MICENIVRIFLILSLFSSGEACDIPKPQKHGDWFCPPSTDPATCHLECHPGYVSTNATVITCRRNHWWSEDPECVTAVAIITGDAYRSNTVEVKQFELSDYKSTALEEKIEMKTNETLVKVTNELLTSKNDKMERQINELIEKTNTLEEENKKITKLNNQQKGQISKMEEKLVHVNGIVTKLTMNQLDIEKVNTEYDNIITKHGQDINDILYWLNDAVGWKDKSSECVGYKTIIYPGNICSPNYPSSYPAHVDCSFTLIPRPGKSVYLEFTYFSGRLGAYGYNTCEIYDYVEMDPPINGVSKFCTANGAPPTTTFDVDQQVTVRFVTNDKYDTGHGWNAIFNIV